MAKDLADLQSYDRAKAALAGDGDELIPYDHANPLLDEQNPLRVYRDLSGLVQATLAECSRPYLAVRGNSTAAMRLPQTGHSRLPQRSLPVYVAKQSKWSVGP